MLDKRFPRASTRRTFSPSDFAAISRSRSASVLRERAKSRLAPELLRDCGYTMKMRDDYAAGEAGVAARDALAPE